MQRLQLIYLRLLSTRSGLQRQVQVIEDQRLDLELSEAERRLASLDDRKNERIAKSISSTIEILKRRLDNLSTAKQNVDFIDSELRRIEHQTELIIEDAALSKDPDDVARRIDAVTSTFDETQDWIKQSKDLMKEVGFELSSTPTAPPPQTTQF